jgi:dCTP deaminase
MQAWEAAGRPLVFPYDATRVTAASYILSVGDEVFISPSSESDVRTRRLLKPRESCVIPPGQFAFLLTQERVRIPSDALAFITLRSKATKFRGLVNVSGFHVDPGYEGRLIFAVFNAGPGPVQVARGDRWFEIFFADLAGAHAEHADRPGGYDSIPTDLITPLATQFQSFAGLEAEIKKTRDDLSVRLHGLEREHTVVRWAAVLIAGALLTVGLKSCMDEKAKDAASQASRGTDIPPATPAAPAAFSPGGVR